MDIAEVVWGVITDQGKVQNGIRQHQAVQDQGYQPEGPAASNY
jgi:hypothetical protein